eukprot:CAMPEP_0179113014 /NCGR_PEP_ID=MMETSP0796-20121207/52856_1 /TAXON_ID=73915 /ORGANISM="Pyrodinium bahamense, Strain pbaha01" /LENGTH=51 /DNA_ID=CAMNT_0020811201 /DNA_START=18 /DNA_END=170 /DNA_ORIENTATION=+
MSSPGPQTWRSTPPHSPQTPAGSGRRACLRRRVTTNPTCEVGQAAPVAGPN